MEAETIDPSSIATALQTPSIWKCLLAAIREGLDEIDLDLDFLERVQRSADDKTPGRPGTPGSPLCSLRGDRRPSRCPSLATSRPRRRRARRRSACPARRKPCVDPPRAPCACWPPSSRGGSSRSGPSSAATMLPGSAERRPPSSPRGRLRPQVRRLLKR